MFITNFTYVTLITLSIHAIRSTGLKYARYKLNQILYFKTKDLIGKSNRVLRKSSDLLSDCCQLSITDSSLRSPDLPTGTFQAISQGRNVAIHWIFHKHLHTFVTQAFQQ